MVRGVWLSRETLEGILERIAAIYGHGGEFAPPTSPDDERLDRFLGTMAEIHAAGFVFMDHHIEELSGLLRVRGRAEDGKFVEGMRAGG